MTSTTFYRLSEKPKSAATQETKGGQPTMDLVADDNRKRKPLYKLVGSVRKQMEFVIYNDVPIYGPAGIAYHCFHLALQMGPIPS